MLIRISTIAAALFLTAGTATADIIGHTFQLDTEGTITGNTLVISEAFSSGGVSFTAELTAVGGGNSSGTDDLNRNTAGIGVDGSGNAAFNESEYVEFSLVLSGITGGIVFFDGFNEIDLNSFTSTETAAISTDSAFNNPGDTILTAETSSDIFSLPSLNSFFVVSNGDSSNTFRIDDVTVQFTTAVPEPSSALFLAAVGVGAYVRRRRRK